MSARISPFSPSNSFTIVAYMQPSTKNLEIMVGFNHTLFHVSLPPAHQADSSPRSLGMLEGQELR